MFYAVFLFFFISSTPRRVYTEFTKCANLRIRWRYFSRKSAYIWLRWKIKFTPCLPRASFLAVEILACISLLCIEKFITFHVTRPLNFFLLWRRSLLLYALARNVINFLSRLHWYENFLRKINEKYAKIRRKISSNFSRKSLEISKNIINYSKKLPL